tara:strand:- start:236 stop:415 length:180 start_codon:yes stop_codon:yes gene_type:complete
MPINRDEERRLFTFSTIKGARELISKINRLTDKIDANGFRFKLVSLWPLTFDIRIKNND